MDAGQQVGGRYRLEERLASEHRLTIYRALDEDAQEPVILHVYPHLPLSEGDPWLDLGLRVPELVERLAELVHPHLAGPQAIVGLDGGGVAVVYPWLEGQRLDQRLTDGPLSPEQTLRLATDLSSALQALHARGLVHRDIKPRNVWLTDHGAVLTGLEWAQMPSDLVASGPRARHPGSLAYMSPEQAGSGGPLDARSDIYSLGMVLVEALGGSPAAGSGATAGDPLGGGHGALGFVLARATRPDPTRRYQTARELAEDLALLAQGSVAGRLRLYLQRLPRAAWALGSLGAVVLVWALLGAGNPDNTATGLAAQERVGAGAPIAWVVETELASMPADSPPIEAAAALRPADAEASMVDALPVELRVGQFIERAFLADGEVHHATVRVAGGRGYRIATANLAPGVDTLLDVSYNGQRTSNDDAWPGTLASSVFVLPSQDTTLSVRVTNRGVVGETATYELLVVEADPTPTPTSEPTATAVQQEGVTMTPRPTYTPLVAATSTPAATRTPRPTSTLRPTYTPRPTVSPTPSVTPSPVPTSHPTATATPPRTVLPIKTATTPVW